MQRNSTYSQRFGRSFVIPLVATCLIGYFAYYAFFGERGLRNLLQLEKKIVVQSEKLQNLEHEKTALEKKVVQLRPSSVDPDLLDQQARTVLNYSAPNDVVIMRDNAAAPPAKK